MSDVHHSFGPVPLVAPALFIWRASMGAPAVGSRERTVLFLTTPALWPHWPFLPVVRRTRGREELGVVFDARAADLTGYSSTVVLTNLFLLPPTFDAFLALPKEVFDSAEELADAAWRVD